MTPVSETIVTLESKNAINISMKFFSSLYFLSLFILDFHSTFFCEFHCFWSDTRENEYSHYPTFTKMKIFLFFTVTLRSKLVTQRAKTAKNVSNTHSNIKVWFVYVSHSGLVFSNLIFICIFKTCENSFGVARFAHIHI